ncbi:MAG: hypothetical protein HDT10_05565 [Helicobacter sp.]|nr:hypothetical protein [Helicobacter sp.]
MSKANDEAICNLKITCNIPFQSLRDSMWQSIMWHIYHLIICHCEAFVKGRGNL